MNSSLPYQLSYLRLMILSLADQLSHLSEGTSFSIEQTYKNNEPRFLVKKKQPFKEQLEPLQPQLN